MASLLLRALRQRSTHGCSPSMSRSPQWTTSWSSTTSTRRRRSAVPEASQPGLTSGPFKRHRQPHAPAAGLALAELDNTARLQGLERGQLEPHADAGRARPPVHAVVAHLHRPQAVLSVQRDLDPARGGVLVRVAHRLREHGLREGLERARDGRLAARRREPEAEVAVRALEALDLREER